MAVPFATVELPPVSADFRSTLLLVNDFSFQQIIIAPHALIDQHQPILILTQLALSMTKIILPKTHIFAIRKDQLPFTTFLVLQPAALVVDIGVFIEVVALV